MNAIRIPLIIINFTFIFWFVLNKCQCEVPESMTKMKTVKDRILNGYDKLIRPITKDSNTTQVYLSFVPRQLIDVDESIGLLKLDSFLYMHWNDSRLKWNLADYNGTFAFPSDLIWLPDISVYNSHSLSVNPMSEVLTYIMNDGGVWWFPPVLTQTSCQSVIKTAYPYDEVVCNISMGSWAHDGWQMNISHSEIMYMGHFENIHSRWEMLVDKVLSVMHVHTYENHDDRYLEIEYSFPLKRRPIPEIEATRIPCILVMLLTLSVFWLPPSSSKKVLILGFQLLALAIMIVYVAGNTKLPTAVLFATSFLQSTMYIVVISFLLQILIVFNLCNLSGPARPPPLVMQLLTGPFGKYACLRWPINNDNLPIDRIQLKEDSSPVINSPTAKDDWMLFAAGLDRLFFVLVSIAMIAVHHL